MSFPALTVCPGGAITSEATGVPSNGNNSFSIGFTPDNPNWVTFEVLPVDTQVTGCTFVSLVGSTATLNFVQGGTGVVRVIAILTASSTR